MKVPNISFHQNPYGVSRVLLPEGRKDKTKLTVNGGSLLPTRLKINIQKCSEVNFTETLESISLNGIKDSVTLVGLKIQESNGRSSSYVHMMVSTSRNALVNLSVSYARLSNSAVHHADYFRRNDTCHEDCEHVLQERLYRLT